MTGLQLSQTYTCFLTHLDPSSLRLPLPPARAYDSLKAQSAARLGNILARQLLDLGVVRLHILQLLPAPRRDRLYDDPDRAVGVALHDVGRATDELVERLPKGRDVTLERLRDQRLGKRL
jgi:hypothetical protein